jgi:hypothetical protein
MEQMNGYHCAQPQYMRPYLIVLFSPNRGFLEYTVGLFQEHRQLCFYSAMS